MDNFSPNMLKTFKECPKKYYYRYVKKISVPQKSAPFEKGKKIHALANYYLRGDDISKLEKTLNKDELAVWESLKSNEYFQKTYINSEYNLSCKINDYWVGGRLDALVKDDDRYYILDYKTGSIPQNPEFDFQTIIYLLAADKFLKDSKELSFVYIDLKNNTNYKIDLTGELREKYTEQITAICKQITTAHEFFKNTKCCKYCEYNKFC